MSSSLSTPDQRAVILEAALAILGTDGAKALTVRNVAAAAGCSTTGVYTWFGGKHGLIDAVYADGFIRFRAALNRVRRRPGWRAADELRARGLRYRSWALANPTHYLLMFGNSVPGFEPSPDAQLVSMAAFEDLVAQVAAVVDEGQAIGAPPLLAYHLWATIHGYVMLELTGRNVIVGDGAERYADGIDRALTSLAADGLSSSRTQGSGQ
ncbi:MAG: TetR/AcrR family transcriptional regulator [Acidimicrobiia bacterium]|nr:TetR/AcrR family transcriptional regulator [Acidimicrobiia bacterium]MDH4363753.1 TetR/AcrR family transcriptional regulator [Acidimicrobiia bacterium]MDH5291370.1 TetR/AcrR family transcriptional regulator [Acidimicrobiia bacterium]